MGRRFNDEDHPDEGNGKARSAYLLHARQRAQLMLEYLAHIPVPGNEATILGKLVAVLRRFSWSMCPSPEQLSEWHR